MDTVGQCSVLGRSYSVILYSRVNSRVPYKGDAMNVQPDQVVALKLHIMELMGIGSWYLKNKQYDSAQRIITAIQELTTASLNWE